MDHRTLTVTVKCNKGHSQRLTFKVVKEPQASGGSSDVATASSDGDGVVDDCSTCGSDIEWSAAIWGS